MNDTIGDSGGSGSVAREREVTIVGLYQRIVSHDVLDGENNIITHLDSHTTADNGDTDKAVATGDEGNVYHVREHREGAVGACFRGLFVAKRSTTQDGIGRIGLIAVGLSVSSELHTRDVDVQPTALTATIASVATFGRVHSQLSADMIDAGCEAARKQFRRSQRQRR